MAHFLIGGEVAQLEARDKDRALQKYMFDQRMAREQEARDYARQADQRQWNYNLQNQARLRDMAQQDYDYKRKIAEYEYNRRVEQDKRADAERWVNGLDNTEFATAAHAVYNGDDKVNLNPYQREAVRLAYMNRERANQSAEDTLDAKIAAEDRRHKNAMELQQLKSQGRGGISQRMEVRPFYFQGANPASPQGEAPEDYEGQETSPVQYYRNQPVPQTPVSSWQFSGRGYAPIPANAGYGRYKGRAQMAVNQASKYIQFPEDTSLDGKGTQQLKSDIAQSAFELARDYGMPLETAVMQAAQNYGLKINMPDGYIRINPGVSTQNARRQAPAKNRTVEMPPVRVGAENPQVTPPPAQSQPAANTQAQQPAQYEKTPKEETKQEVLPFEAGIDDDPKYAQGTIEQVATHFDLPQSLQFGGKNYQTFNNQVMNRAMEIARQKNIWIQSAAEEAIAEMGFKPKSAVGTKTQGEYDYAPTNEDYAKELIHRRIADYDLPEDLREGGEYSGMVNDHINNRAWDIARDNDVTMSDAVNEAIAEQGFARKTNAPAQVKVTAPARVQAQAQQEALAAAPVRYERTPQAPAAQATPPPVEYQRSEPREDRRYSRRQQEEPPMNEYQQQAAQMLRGFKLTSREVDSDGRIDADFFARIVSAASMLAKRDKVPYAQAVYDLMKSLGYEPADNAAQTAVPDSAY